MPKPELSIIIPAHNEEQLISACIASVAGDLATGKVVERPELIVVASRCTDSTRYVAERSVASLDFPARVISTRRKGKKAALNTGLEAAQGDVAICVDGDLVVTHNAIPTMFEDLHRPGVRLVGCQVAPVVDEKWINTRPAPSIDMLTFAKRQVTRPHKSVRGDMVGYFRKDMIDGYPHGAAPDDAWLSASVGLRYGLGAIHVSDTVGVMYIPPMNIKDLTSQLTRYRMSESLVIRDHPDLAQYYEQLRAHWRTIDGGDMTERWRAQAQEMGLKFDHWKERYDRLLSSVDRYTRERCRLPRGDF